MNTSISTSISANVTPAQQQSRPPQPSGLAARPDQAEALIALGSMLTHEVQESILSGAKLLEETGATPEEIMSFVDGRLGDSGVDISDAQQRSGQFVDIVS